MKSIRKPALALIVSAVAVTSLAACAGGGGTASTSANYVDGKPFTLALAADPGNLDPQASAVSALFALTHFAYDPLVNVDAKGKVSSGLAKEWKLDGTTATFTLKSGVTCSDGSTFTAKTAADNVSWVEDPANKSPFLGAFIPAGITAAADTSAGTVTLTLSTPAPFLLQSLANLPMVCDAGLADRSKLATATLGTGPYVLSEAVPNDHYTYKVNKKYTWGPGGASTSAKGTPATVTAKIITNETTAANLLLSGQVNSAQILGPDADRLAKAKLFSQDTPALIGEQWYNNSTGHPTSDPAVRMALTQAVDLGELQKVLTSGKGVAATGFAVIPPVGCAVDSVSGALPKKDVSAAKSALDAAGWKVGSDGIREKDGVKLNLTFIYDSSLGAGGTAASELATKAWEAIGAKVTATQNDETAVSAALFGTGAWDISWEPLNVNSPDQLVGFLSGPAAPKGTNFANIQNADYSSAVAKAMTMNGTDGCQTWADAESALVKAADVVPFANNIVKTFGKGATFQAVGGIVPTSIRMLG